MQTPLFTCRLGYSLFERCLYSGCDLNGTHFGMIISEDHPELISIPIMTITRVNALHCVAPCAY